MKQFFLKVLVVTLLFTKHEARAQNTDTVLNILKAPTSPAANLLGISPSDVQRPTDPSAFIVSLQNATTNYSALPSSYAVDVAPAWLFAGSKISYAEFVDAKPSLSSIWQSFLLSVATTNGTDSLSNNPALGLGFKVSVIRGRVNKKALAMVDSAGNVMDAIGATIGKAIDSLIQTPKYDTASPDLQAAMIIAMEAQVREEVQELSDQLVELAKEVEFTRYGWKLDLAAGASMAFPGQSIRQRSLDRAGVWLTGGYESENGVAALGLLRYLYNPDKVFADEAGILRRDNLSTFDAGLRLLYDNGHKFTFSAEGVYRSVLNKTEVNPTWRATLNADYKISPNRILTLALGRDYDGTFSKDGNLIAALNLVLGFGNNRGRQGT